VLGTGFTVIMADPLISALLALQQQNRNFTVLLGLYDTMTSTDILWSRRRYNVPRVKQYLQLTVANYTLDDFKTHYVWYLGTNQNGIIFELLTIHEKVVC
jgi:hypothetical protein